MSERILRLVGPIHVVAGLLVFASAFLPAAQDLMKPLVISDDPAIWSDFFVAILGPTIASWGVLYTALVNSFYDAPSLCQWRALVWSIVVWAPLDTALCLKYDVVIGAIINGAIVAALAALLWTAKRQIPK